MDKVRFKKFPEGDVLALFYELPAGNGYITSYQHVGQHSAAAPELLTDLEDATPEEYEELKKELIAIGYDLTGNIKERLEYLRGEIEAERISYGEIAELQTLKEHIEPDDVVLLEWAGVEEN